MSQVAPRRLSDVSDRGVVTVLFVTMGSFTALCEEHDPSEIGSILDIYLETVADSVRKFLGIVQNTMADTVMATWNAVYPQTEHAVLAVNSAIDMAERIEDVNQRLRARSLPEITYAVGINTGDALVRHLPLGHREGDVIGDSVNIAHLLSLLGSECTILIGEGTRVSVGEQVLVEETEPTPLPGRVRPLRIFRVIGRMSPI